MMSSFEYPNFIIVNQIMFSVLLLGSIQAIAVHPLPDARDAYLLPYLLPCFCFSWSPSLGSSIIVVVFLFSSYREVSIGKYSLANDYVHTILNILFCYYCIFNLHRHTALSLYVRARVCVWSSLCKLRWKLFNYKLEFCLCEFIVFSLNILNKLL